MKLELRKATDGTHFVVCICSEKQNRQLVVPLSPKLSEQIDAMLTAEGFTTNGLFVAPKLRGIRHEKLT